MDLGSTTPLPVGKVVTWGGLRIDGRDLVYDVTEDPHDSSADGLLEAFMRIRVPDDALRFSMRFGVLWLCRQHGLPTGLNWTGPVLGMSAAHDRRCALRGYPQCREPLSRWLAFAAQARSIVELAGHLHGGGPVKLEERVAAWRVLYEGLVRDGAILDKLSRGLAAESRRRNAVMFLGEYLNYWLELGGARPAVIWPTGRFVGDADKGPSLELRAAPAGVFGVMAIQLATAVTRSEAIYVCAGCRQSYLRTERASRSGRNYCLACKGQGIHERDRKRRQRAFKRQTAL